MKISVRLLTSKKPTDDGYPIVVRASHKDVKVQKNIGWAFPQHFSNDAQMITDRHPDYDILAEKILNIKIRARKMALLDHADPARAIEDLFKPEATFVRFGDFIAEWLAEQRGLMAVYEKNGDTVARNKVSGNVSVVENVKRQFEAFNPRGVAVAELSYQMLEKFRMHNKTLGNSDHTVHLYLRTLRALYNRAVKKYGLPDKEPFKGMFDGLRIKSYEAKKKYLDKETVALLEGLRLGVMHGRARDFFLLQFYFGGADLIDLYYLKKTQLRKGRVRFERGKTNHGALINLKIHPKAQAIIDRHKADDPVYLFGWGKTVPAYENFRRRIQRCLLELQKAQNAVAEAEKNEALRLDVLPYGGNLGIKVARHTFANLAKYARIDPDLIRELMGHRRDDVDNFYKDMFPEPVRDEALFKIIG